MSGDAGAFEKAIAGLSGLERAHTVPGYEHVEIFRGEFRDDGRARPATLRAMPPDVVTPTLAEDFFAVARNWRKVATHPNVVEILEWGDEPDPWVLVSDTSGDTLRAVGSELPSSDVVEMVSDVAEALRNGALYNLSHLHLRPVYVRLPTQRDVAEVDDWGLERAVATHAEDEYCTPYTAPEQLDGASGVVGERADVYGLAGLTYFALTGNPPATASRHSILHEEPVPPSEFVDGVPEAVDSLLGRAFDTDPAARPDSPFAFATQLRRAFEPARGVSTGEHSPKSGATAGDPGTRQQVSEAETTPAQGDSGLTGGVQRPTVRRRTLLKAGVGVAALGALGVAASRLLGSDSAPDPVLQSVPDTADFVTHGAAQSLLSDSTLERTVSRDLSRQIDSLDTTTVGGVLDYLIPGFDLRIEDVQDVIAFGATRDSPDSYFASILQTAWNSSAVRDQLSRLGATTDGEYRERPIYVVQSSRLPWTSLVSDLGGGEFVIGTRPEIEDVIDVYDGVTEPVGGPVHQAFASTGEGVVRFGFDASASLVDPEELDVPGARLLEQTEYGYGSVGTTSDRQMTLTVRAVSSSAADDIESQFSALLVLARDQIDRTPIVNSDEELYGEIQQLLDAATVEKNAREVSVRIPDGRQLLSIALPLLFRVEGNLAFGQ